ncbi:hypothetical protein LUZ60_009287 [Juncus effusus]|nr:hypothetical protein LUZ60_009287 [Juncus effusus]
MADHLQLGPSKLTKLQNGCQKTRVSTHYPFQHERKTLKEIFSLLPSFKNSEDLPDEIKQINSDSAEKFVFKNEPKNLGIDFECVGYSLEASLDVILTKQLFAKKIFVGQKIRIWGASLCGWVGPVSFLEANGTVSLSLHINGTYRASWDEPLGFCKKIGPPLAFKCIKSSGGVIPMTLVGIKRVYPLLYKERLSNGASIVRSERMETDALQLYHQRRSNIAEDIISKQQEICLNSNSNEHCEGSKISKLIEKSAEPEVLMAGLNSEQLNSLFSYHSKQKEIRQGEMGKKIEKALEKAGLGARDISPFMKLRIVGLNCINSSKKGRNKEGLVTIWNPTDRHKMELVEGKMYKVMGLTPSNFGGEILYLQARGSSTIWRPLHSLQSDYFESFFTPRKAVQLCNLGEVPLASEFDIAGSVLFVGDVYISDQQKRQWVFISDGSNIESESEETCCDSILAINFFSPLMHNDDSSLKLFNHTLQGSTVGFLNLVKRARDQNENIWLAEATEYSTYSLSSNLKNNTSHLKEAATSAEKWAKTSPSSIERLRERVSCLINCQGK